MQRITVDNTPVLVCPSNAGAILSNEGAYPIRLISGSTDLANYMTLYPQEKLMELPNGELYAYMGGEERGVISTTAL